MIGFGILNDKKPTRRPTNKPKPQLMKTPIKTNEILPPPMDNPRRR